MMNLMETVCWHEIFLRRNISTVSCKLTWLVKQVQRGLILLSEGWPCNQDTGCTKVNHHLFCGMVGPV